MSYNNNKSQKTVQMPNENDFIIYLSKVDNMLEKILIQKRTKKLLSVISSNKAESKNSLLVALINNFKNKVGGNN